MVAAPTPVGISHVAARSKGARRNLALQFWSQRHVLLTGIFSVLRLSIEARARRFENVTCKWLANEGADATRTALGARAADVGEHRNTEYGFPPLHACPLVC